MITTVNSEGVANNTTNIMMPLAFKRIIESDKNNIMVWGGRLGGKTNNGTKVAILTMLAEPYYDIVMCRVSYGSLQDSSFAESEAAISELPEYISSQFVSKKSPLRISRIHDAGNIYFMGYGGSNTSRTKSFKPKHKIKIVILEETQELKSEQNLNEALASLRRHFGEGVKVLIMFNPRPQEAHWLNILKNKKMMDADWLVVQLTYLDILPFINDYDLKEILKTKYLDEQYYNWFYLGLAEGGYGSVYPMYKKEKYEITVEQFEWMLEYRYLTIKALIIGLDFAVNNDCTAGVPMFVMSNGQICIGPIFYHNPKEDGVLGAHQMVQNHIVRWFNEIVRRYHLGTREEIMSGRTPGVPVYMRIDSAAADGILECKFAFNDRGNVGPIKKKTIPEMVGFVQSAICNYNIIVVNYHGYYDYQKNRWVNKQENLLSEQLSMLTWNDKQNGYEPEIPNDVSDAFTYPCFWWFINQENIQYFNILKMQGAKNKLIHDIINNKS